MLSLNYTSGTTGRPKGVMYAHRGAYLQALAMTTQAALDSTTVFLWTLPMFYCNGWCYPLQRRYGLMETYGPAVICDWHPEWDELDSAVQAHYRSRQGVSNLLGMPLRVVDDAGNDVPADGETRGEVVLVGNNVMLGYYRDPEATMEATVNGADGNWFRTGDVGVMHSDNFLELRDRFKDLIISGGENTASIEVEQALDSHPDVFESAVVAAPDEKWGEVPVAFVSLRPEANIEDGELIDYVKSRIARFKAPRRVVRGDLPKTSTGKIQKYMLRESLQQQHREQGS